MRVLVAHNRYRSGTPSGENLVVEDEIQLLRDADVVVEAFLPSSDDIDGMSPLGKLETAVGPVYQRSGVSHFKRLLDDFRPDVVHVHNVFPLISPAAVNLAADAGIPVVQTLHNYRHACVNGLHLRDGKRCDDCIGTRTNWPAVRHGCYRGSRLQTLPMVASQHLHRGTWRRLSRVFALTGFMRDRAVLAGIPEQLIQIRPTWAPDPGPRWSPPGAHVLYVGRLDEPKGVGLLLDAWETNRPAGLQLQLVGDGPMLGRAQTLAAKEPSLQVLGRLDGDALTPQYENAALVVIPSLVYEGLPRVFVEALAHGRPILATSGGSVGSAVVSGTGWTVSPNPTKFAQTLERVFPLIDEAMAIRCRQQYEMVHSPTSALASLVTAYDEVIASRRRDRA